MVKLKTLVSFLDDYLRTAEVKDSSWNGLQVEGRETVRRVIGAVDAGLETFQAACSAKGDLLLVHHGLFWKQSLPYLTGVNRERIKFLLDNHLSLYASHLPLDRHPVSGNNALLLRLIGAKKEREFFFYEGQSISWIGVFHPPVTVRKILVRLESSLKTKCQLLPFGPKEIRTVAVCSGGGGASAFQQAVNGEVDLYITGEATEIYHLAKDYRCSVIFGGHHATETTGVRALLRLLQARYRVETRFVDIPTGL
ncbi:MAG: Nif3-like dinuclear metal center hexameric protein [Candidatus Omnitrophica bacterium]|nr:Nif3-like dinuclear metal center hexameric protein [Candidatus Omnitrophota bacterium]